jgi:molecular chaperone DnaK
MRSTVDFGIDLGTTNSAIAVFEDGHPRVIRNSQHDEITPSAVMVDRNGRVLVRKTAYNQAVARSDRVAREFKRAMGTDQRYALGNQTMSPEELSSEVIKSLRMNVQENLHEEVRAAVITVPAWFTLAADHATMQAAELAGIEFVRTLQEPIAAGLAYGYQNTDASGYWLVYDFGGGTFDAALMTIREGFLQVVDHAGDEYLGGSDFDNTLVDFVVEELRKDYTIEGIVRGSGVRQQLYAKLKYVCEESKILLSRQEAAEVEINGVADDAGIPIDSYITVSRSVFERLIAPLVDRSISLCRNLLARQNLPMTAVQRVVMVGGPTYSPYVRRRIHDELGVDIEGRIDPMTVVAQGAAIFAGAVRPERSSPRKTEPNAAAYSIDLKYPPVSDEADVLIGGRIDGPQGPALAVQIDREDGGWTSGRVPVTSGVFRTRLNLRERRPNTFTIRLFDPEGSRLAASPDQLTITQGLTAGAPPLARSLGVVVAKGNEQETQILFPHGTPLPGTASKSFHTTEPMGAGHPATLKIHIVEGEYLRPERNEHVGYVDVDLSRCPRTVPAGEEVEVTLNIDTSRNIAAHAFVPFVDQTFSSTIEARNIHVPEIGDLDRLLQAERQRLAEIEDIAPTREAEELANETERALAEARSGDSAAVMRAKRRLAELQEEIDRVGAVAELPLLRKRWNTELSEAKAALTDYGQPGDRQMLLMMEHEGVESADKGDVPKLRERLEALQKLRWQTVFAQPGWWIGLYQYLVEHQREASDQPTTRVLVQEGRRALDRQDIDALKQACRRLWELMPNSDPGSKYGLPDVRIRG